MVYGFIGLGNMAGAILRGMEGSGNFSRDTLCGFNRSPGKTRKLAQEIGLVPCESAKEVAEKADVLVLGVKPQMLPDVLEPIKGAIHPDKLVVTIAAGKGFSFYASYFGENVPLVRVMPNICAQVLCSASAVCPNAACTPEQVELVRAMFRSVGEVYDIPEAQFSAFFRAWGSFGRVRADIHRRAFLRGREGGAFPCARAENCLPGDARRGEALPENRRAPDGTGRQGHLSRRHDDRGRACA